MEGHGGEGDYLRNASQGKLRCEGNTSKTERGEGVRHVASYLGEKHFGQVEQCQSPEAGWC